MRYRKSHLRRVRPRVKVQKRPISVPLPFLIVTVLMLLALASQAQAATLPTGMPPLSRAVERLGTMQHQAQQAFEAGYAAYDENDFELALRHWQPAAQQGHMLAQFFMGVLHDLKMGAWPDAREAFSWYARAAAQGHAQSQHNLAMAYARGEGVSKNIHQAVHWWRKAARQGNADSQYNLGVIYAIGGEGLMPDLLKAEQWWRRAALSGDPLAQYNLGALYANGVAGKPDYCEAFHWWDQSRQNGLEKANDAFHQLQAQVNPGKCK